jgi:hypothetical protein
MLAGHYALWLAIPFTALIIAADATGRPGWLTWTEAGAQAAFIAALIISFTYHDAKLCERCMAATPLDPQAAVNRWRPALRLDHTRWLLLIVLIANLAWGQLTAYLFINGVHALGLPRHHAPWAYFTQDIPMVIIIVGYWTILRVHRNLYPWCPWCKWGRGGGPQEAVPDPDPEDHGVKPVPA